MTNLQVHPSWATDANLLAVMRGLAPFPQTDDRVTGYLYDDDARCWPPSLQTSGVELLDRLEQLTSTRFTIVAYQGYRNGSGCGWHADIPFDMQAVLSLGVTRTFGVRQLGGQARWSPVAHGDLVVMPSGFQREWEHCVPQESVVGDRYSLVFRTPAKG